MGQNSFVRTDARGAASQIGLRVPAKGGGVKAGDESRMAR